MSFAPPPTPYPPSRHDGQPSATARLRTPDVHDLVYPDGSWVDYLTTGSSTNGDFGLYRWHMSGQPSGPDPHFHRTMSESFFVLDGEVQLFDGKTHRTGRPGDFMYVPEGGTHGFRNESGQAATMLILFAPGAPRESYFEGLAQLAQTAPAPSDAEMTEFYTAHDTFWIT